MINPNAKFDTSFYIQSVKEIFKPYFRLTISDKFELTFYFIHSEIQQKEYPFNAIYSYDLDFIQSNFESIMKGEVTKEQVINQLLIDNKLDFKDVYFFWKKEIEKCKN